MNDNAAVRRLLLIINPISGVGTKESIEPLVREAMTAEGYEVEVAFTAGRGDATRLAKEAVDKRYDAVLAAGGDGTVNETAAALCGSETALGIIPCGSGNGLARHLGIPIDIRESIRVIHDETPHSIDYATVNDKKFFCTFGVGFDAAVSAAFAEKKRRGKLTYIQSTFQTYAHYEPELYTITANGQTITEKAFLVAVCNASQYGNNAYIAPSATIDDGLLDVTIIHAGNPFSTALVGVDMLIGNIERNMLIQSFRTPSLTIRRKSSGAAHLDGEPLELDDVLDIRCNHRQLRVFSPASLPPFKPFVTPATAMLADFRLAVHKLFQK